MVAEIESKLQEGDQLDAERRICEKYNVSRTTVRQTLFMLEKERYIYKVAGKGNYVSKKRVEQQLVKFYSFTDEMKKIGRKPQSIVLSFTIEEANEKIATKLKVSPKELLYKIVRIRLADEIPMIYETTYLPYEYFDKLTKETLEEKPMYKVLQNTYNIEINSANEYLEPVLSDKIESSYLKIPKNSPCLKIERVAYQNTKIMEYTLSIARGDQFKYTINLKNN